MRIAASEDGKTLSEVKIHPTPKTFEEGMQQFAEFIPALTADQPVIGAAGGIAGVLNREKESLIHSSNLPEWVHKDLRGEISRIVQAPTYLENDTAIVGLGEAVHGAGQGRKLIAYMTLSTGVGGARIIEGRIAPYVLGFEPGHQIINPNGPVCPGCGGQGDLESYVSGRALQEKYGMPGASITDTAIWQEVAKHLALGLHNTIVHWSPDIVVLGGSVALNALLSLENIRSELQAIMKIFPEIPLIEKATLENLGGLYGGLVYLAQNSLA